MRMTSQVAILSNFSYKNITYSAFKFILCDLTQVAGTFYDLYLLTWLTCCAESGTEK